VRDTAHVAEGAGDLELGDAQPVAVGGEPVGEVLFGVGVGDEAVAGEEGGLGVAHDVRGDGDQRPEEVAVEGASPAAQVGADEGVEAGVGVGLRAGGEGGEENREGQHVLRRDATAPAAERCNARTSARRWAPRSSTPGTSWWWGRA